MTEKSLRDQIRAATVGSKTHFASKNVTWEGFEVEIRQPSYKSRKDLYKKCRDGEGNVDPTEFLVWSVIENTFVPGTDEKVFEKADYEGLISKPAGGFIDEFGAVAIEMFNPDKGKN